MFWHFILLLVGALLFFGGLGMEVARVQYFGVLVGLVILFLAKLCKRRVDLPHGFRLFSLFLFAFLISIIWSQDRRRSFEFLVLFIGGGLFWLGFYNLREKFKKGFPWMLIFLGLAFGELFAISEYFGGLGFNYLSLFLPVTPARQHNHLGDFWALVLIVAAYLLTKKKRKIALLLIVLGGFFLTMSLSRASYVALIVGILYLFIRKGLVKHKRLIWFFIALSTTLFLYAGTKKSTLLSRPYFIQAIAGFLHHPLGVGVRNFPAISSDPANQLFSMRGFSVLAHNIILEFMTGMGIIALVFIAWLTQIGQAVWQNKSSKTFLFQALFVALSINFLFDYTYIIPTMLWLWFMTLGLSYDEKIHA